MCRAIRLYAKLIQYDINSGEVMQIVEIEGRLRPA